MRLLPQDNRKINCKMLRFTAHRYGNFNNIFIASRLWSALYTYVYSGSIWSWGCTKTMVTSSEHGLFVLYTFIDVYVYVYCRIEFILHFEFTLTLFYVGLRVCMYVCRCIYTWLYDTFFFFSSTIQRNCNTCPLLPPAYFLASLSFKLYIFIHM